MDDLDKLQNRLMKNPAFRKEYEATRVEFEIARAVIGARIKKGLTQADLAKAMNTKQSVISRVENAKTVPSLSFLKRLAEVLDASLQVQFKTQ